MILYPSGKVSDIQERQLTTLGQNITALEVDGFFDDCQDMVKKAFLDNDLKSNNLTSANSINIARWLPQMIYFFIAGENKIVAIVVCDECILMPIIKGIEQTICVLFGLVEPNNIVLILVAKSVAEDADTPVGIGKNESAKIACERLRSHSNGEEIVVRTHVCDFCFIEPFLERPVRSMSIGPVANIGRDHCQLLNFEIVLIEDGVHPKSPIKRLEGRVTFK